ncbi:MAG: glycerol-3-phosphate 1-O-acyltransferase PlsY [Candidatus Aminicenantes bacterium]|nr:glycerol-3-phosphate 1-O-acyltransferase PlsY [Candidatus Aminicenantes bacterium]
MKIIYSILSYLLGAVPSGYIIYRLVKKKDIRKEGSGSTGATNVLRLMGFKFALPVLLFDFLKGFLPAFLALRIFPDRRVALVCAFLAVLGHCYPVYIGFRGGKGIATMMGVYASLGILPCLLSLGVFILTVALTRYVSLGSILASLGFPLFTLAFIGDIETLALSLAIFVLVVIRHKGNIQRLLQGNERKLGEKT